MYNKPQRDASALNTPISNYNEDDTFRIYQGVWSNILNDHAYLEARGSFVDISFPLYIKDEAKAARNQVHHRIDDEQVTGANQNEYINQRQRLQLNTVLSWYKAQWLGGRHELKFGWDFANNNVSADVTPSTIRRGPVRGLPGACPAFNTPVHPEETIRTNAFFASDTIQRGPVHAELWVASTRHAGACLSPVESGRHVHRRPGTLRRSARSSTGTRCRRGVASFIS